MTGKKLTCKDTNSYVQLIETVGISFIQCLVDLFENP